MQLQQASLFPWWVYGVLCAMPLAIGVVLVRRRSFSSNRLGSLAFVALACLAVVTGFGWAGSLARHHAARSINVQLEGTELRVTGTVAAMPQRNEKGARFVFDIDHVESPDGAVDGVPSRVQLAWYTQSRWQPASNTAAIASHMSLDVRAGQRWAFTVRLKAPHGNVNPNGFDQELWLWEQGIGATGSIRDGGVDAPRHLADTWVHPIEQWRDLLRQKIFATIEDRRSAGIVAALTMGDQNAIEHGDWDIFRKTGVAHLMSISGLHITMFAWLAAVIFGAVWKQSARLGWRLCLWIPAPIASLVLGISLATLYALFSGWGVPAQRTITMLCIFALLRLSARSWPWPLVCLAAMCGVTLFDPWALLQAGFWLSFVAVAILFASGQSAESERAGIWSRFLSHVKEQWVVTFALAPLGVLLFQQISIIGLPANLIAVPYVTLVVTPLAMLGAFVPHVWLVAGKSISLLAWFLESMASIPWATLSLPAIPLWAGVPAIVGGAVIMMKLPRSIRLMGIPLILPMIFWRAPSPEFAQFELIAADIGQGNGVIVRTKNHTLVYDTGPKFGIDSDAGSRVIVPLLSSMALVPDMIVLSHRDSDHTGGAASVMRAFPEAMVLASIEDRHELQGLRPAVRCAAGQRWEWDGVNFEILHPFAPVYPEGDVDISALPKPNTLSCVLRISSGVRTALLVGDIERAQEHALMQAFDSSRLKADMLLVPHHGSKTSSSEEFIEAVRPAVALVQAGYRNSFGHPAITVVERYVDADAKLVNTAWCGAAHWSSVDGSEVRCQRKIRARYWHYGNHY